LIPHCLRQFARGREWVWAVQPQAAQPTPTPYPVSRRRRREVLNRYRFSLFLKNDGLPRPISTPNKGKGIIKKKEMCWLPEISVLEKAL